jgi:hypothetical protein
MGVRAVMKIRVVHLTRIAVVLLMIGTTFGVGDRGIQTNGDRSYPVIDSSVIGQQTLMHRIVTNYKQSRVKKCANQNGDNYAMNRKTGRFY